MKVDTGAGATSFFKWNQPGMTWEEVVFKVLYIYSNFQIYAFFSFLIIFIQGGCDGNPNGE